jgi:cytochrome oxidase Cu insertion factor (SCO1/SenC/PrrC family)
MSKRVKKKASGIMTLQMILFLGVAFAIALIAVMSLGSRNTGVGGPFTLVNQDGKTVTDRDFRGKFMLVYFGYTFCPDVCPTELTVIAGAMDKLGPLADKVAPIFVTVDPLRDTPKTIKTYVADFHPRLIGLTGSKEQVAAAAKAYHVYYRKSGPEQAAADYTVDHSSYVYLMAPDGSFVTHFAFGITADRMADELRKRLSEDKG